MYVFKTANFAELMNVMEGTARRVLEEAQAIGRVATFERYAQEYLDQMGGATLRWLSIWTVNNQCRILFAEEAA